MFPLSFFIFFIILCHRSHLWFSFPVISKSWVFFIFHILPLQTSVKLYYQCSITLLLTFGKVSSCCWKASCGLHAALSLSIILSCLKLLYKVVCLAFGQFVSLVHNPFMHLLNLFATYFYSIIIYGFNMHFFNKHC